MKTLQFVECTTPVHILSAGDLMLEPRERAVHGFVIAEDARELRPVPDGPLVLKASDDEYVQVRAYIETGEIWLEPEMPGDDRRWLLEPESGAIKSESENRTLA